MRVRSSLIALSLMFSPAAASAQGLESLLGAGGLAGVGSAGVGNAAGLLGYCLKNRYLGSGRAGAQGLLGKLTGRPEVKESPGFALGQQGKIEQFGGGALSLDGLTGKLKTRACDMVLKRAGSFL